MIVIVGESASGKSSVAKYLTNNCGYKRIVTYTTRAPRHNEVDGFDYYFIQEDQFEKLDKQDFFAETALYNGWRYGSAKKDYTDDSVIVVNPKGLRNLKNSNIENIFSVYLCVPRRDRLIKCLERGDDIEEAYRRSISDIGMFDGIEKEVDLVIKNPNYLLDVQTITNAIINQSI